MNEEVNEKVVETAVTPVPATTTKKEKIKKKGKEFWCAGRITILVITLVLSILCFFLAGVFSGTGDHEIGGSGGGLSYSVPSPSYESTLNTGSNYIYISTSGTTYKFTTYSSGYYDFETNGEVSFSYKIVDSKGNTIKSNSESSGTYGLDISVRLNAYSDYYITLTATRNSGSGYDTLTITR